VWLPATLVGIEGSSSLSPGGNALQRRGRKAPAVHPLGHLPALRHVMAEDEAGPLLWAETW